jgi:putative flippase GtrA
MPLRSDRRWRRLSRFSVVGATGVVVNNLTLVVLHGVEGMALLPATVAAVEVAIVFNYVLHEVWTFQRMRLSAQRFAYFSLVALAAMPFNVGVVQVLAWLGLYYLVANLVGIIAGFLINFAVSSRWIWSERTDGTSRAGRGRGDLAGADRPVGTRAVSHDLHVGPAGGGRLGAGTRKTCRAAAVLHRHRAGTPRGRGHPGHHQPRRLH